MKNDSNLSKRFLEFVKCIGESRSKQEEDRIILSELQTLKTRLCEPDLSLKHIKECLVQALYVEMLGYNAHFAYIHAVKLTQNKNLICKKVGYLFCSLCFDSKHEFLLLLINTIQKDLESSNYLEIDAALSFLCKILNHEIIATVLPSVLKLAQHYPKDIIRKKGCMVLHAIYVLAPDFLRESIPRFIRLLLCDQSFPVVGAALHLFISLIKDNPAEYLDMVPALVSILKQILDGRVSHDFTYHFVAAPWIQITLLHVLGILGAENQKTSDEIQEILVQVIQKSNLRTNVSFAIVYEAVRTITSIFASRRLLDMASSVVSKFITSENHNLKYVGIMSLASLVRVHPSFAALPEHQLVVMDALEDSDETLKRKTLDLLYRMTNPVNAVAIVDKLLSYLKLPIATAFLEDLTCKICHVADRFAPDQLWYVHTLNKVLMVAGTLVPRNTTQNLFRLVAEGPTGNDEEDQIFRQQTVNIYITLLEENDNLSDILVNIAVWIIGEYGSLNTKVEYETLESLINLLLSCLHKRDFLDTTNGWIMSAVFKLCVSRLIALATHSSRFKALNAQCTLDALTKTKQVIWPARDIRLPPQVLRMLYSFCASPSTSVQQRCVEFYAMVMSPEDNEDFTTLMLLSDLYPFDGACEDIKIDDKMSFLNGYVQDALSKGATPYKSINERQSLYTEVSPATLPPPLSQSEPGRSNTPLSIIHHHFTTSAASAYPEDSLSHTTINREQSPQPRHDDTTKLTAIHNSPKSLCNDSNKPFYQDAFQVQGPRVWGASGYETPNSSNTSKHGHSTLPDEERQSLPPFEQLDVSTPLATRLTSTSQQKRKEAQELFRGLYADDTKTHDSSTSSTPLSYPVKSEQLSDSISSVQPTFVKPTMPKRPCNSSAPDLLDTIWEDTLSTSDCIPRALPTTTLSLESPTLNVRHEELSTIGHSFNESFPLLKPLQTSTHQVEVVWPKLRHEKRQTFKTTLSSFSILFDKLTSGLGAAVVEIVGNEGILAGCELNSMDSTVYIHSRLTPSSFVDFIFRGNDLHLIQSLCQRCQSILTS